MRVPVRERATHSRRPGGVTRQQAVTPAHDSGQDPAVAALAEGVQPSPSAGLCSPATRRSEEAERGWAIPFVYTNHPPGGHAGGRQQRRSTEPGSSARRPSWTLPGHSPRALPTRPTAPAQASCQAAGGGHSAPAHCSLRGLETFLTVFSERAHGESTVTMATEHEASSGSCETL